jgi:hypothetical protein
MTDSRHEMHELGNAIVALQFCLRQLDGRQGTDELQHVVRNGLEVCKQGIAAFRKIRAAVSVTKSAHPADDERARGYAIRAAEYRTIADQMQDATARATYRHLAEDYERMGRWARERSESKVGDVDERAVARRAEDALQRMQRWRMLSMNAAP